MNAARNIPTIPRTWCGSRCSWRLTLNHTRCLHSRFSRRDGGTRAAKAPGTTEVVLFPCAANGNRNLLARFANLVRAANSGIFPNVLEFLQQRGQGIHCKVAGVGGGFRQASDFLDQIFSL